MCTVCLSPYFFLSTVGGRVTASVPPGARISQPSSCVPPTEIASKTKSIGELVIFLTSAATSALRSMTCVAPSDLTRSELDNDAVTMMGEKPESFANWIAVDAQCQTRELHIAKCDWLYCPTEEEPPRTRIGFPLYKLAPPWSQGAINCFAPLPWLTRMPYKPTIAVPVPIATDAASSVVILEGI